MLVNGTQDEEMIYKKSTAMQDWLFGFELANTITVLTLSGVHILTSSADLLEGIADVRPEGLPDLSTTLHRSAAGDNSQNFDNLLTIIRESLEGVRARSSSSLSSLNLTFH